VFAAPKSQVQAPRDVNSGLSPPDPLPRERGARSHSSVFVAAASVCLATTAVAAEATSIADVAADAKPAVVVISYSDRDGQPAGVGSGFVVAADGLIATNLHVIGEARPVTVRFADGTTHAVTVIEATDRASDLALLRVNADDLKPLTFAENEIRDGQEVIAIGHPRGLEHSVVRGVLSGRREIDGRDYLQLAIPVEAGNSGGPVLNREGQVVGIMTMKSAVTQNLGFAVPIAALKPLLEKPNPVPIEHWLTIGQIDRKAWSPVFGGTWRQRAGHIVASGQGAGFGGRSLLLSSAEVPEPPFELAVTVKLGDESGAAGLVFGSNGTDGHFGFYPSAGALRLTRFDGPDVFSWHVLDQIPTHSYRAGEWNKIKVRVESEKVIGFINGSPVAEWAGQIPEGKIGLAAFRGTHAEFKGFRVARELPDDRIDEETLSRLRSSIADLRLDRPPTAGDVSGIRSLPGSLQQALENEAARLERRATRVRQLAAAVHRSQVLEELASAVSAEPPQLMRAALLISKLDNAEVDIEAYLDAMKRLAVDAKAGLPGEATEQDRLTALNRLLFDQLGFHGSRTNYYHRSNSYLNEVIDDREGLPIALSVLYIDLARQLNVKIEGVGLPGHFVVRFTPAKGEPQLIDVFDRGTHISRDEAEQLAGEPLDDAAFASVTTVEILERMLRNLMNLAQRSEDSEAMLRYLEAILVLRPDSGSDRLLHALVCANTDRFEEALADCDQIGKEMPESLDLSRLGELRSYIERRQSEAASSIEAE
jgi:regulator of sirC expression with transglutaminase-like and TPR domain